MPRGLIQIPAVETVDELLQLSLLSCQFVIICVLITERCTYVLIPLHQLCLLADTLHNALDHRLGVVKLRLLGQVADMHTVCNGTLSVILCVYTCYDLHQAGFAAAVDSDDADLGTVVE